MDLQAVLRRFHPLDRRSVLITLGVSFLAYPLSKVLLEVLSPRSGESKILASPRKSLQLLSGQDLEKIPYPTDALPGARDIDTPYGNIRAYEWGPKNGRKVLFVHGISTPCIAFASLARLLVEQHGCRVLLFDLFGRGYSDAPDPAVYRQDIALFASQIMLVLTSSELSLTGEGRRFTMVGYSLGGGISAAFASYFPRLVEGLVLIAPSGLLREKHISWSSRLVYGNLLPEGLVNWYVSRRLKGTPSKTTKEGEETTVVAAAESEVPATHPAHAENSSAPIFPDRPAISPANTVSWLVDAHPGFLPAFISSIKYAPIRGEHSRWRLIGSRQEAQSSSPEATSKEEALSEGKVLILLGTEDNVILADEVEEDAKAALGEQNVDVVRLKGGHDLPIVNAKGCLVAIADFWRTSAV